MATSTKTPAKSAPAAASKKAAPKVADYEGENCPQCKRGLLIVTAFDPAASHEWGQTIEPGRNLSGGAVARTCFECSYHESFGIEETEQSSAKNVPVGGPA